MLSFIVDDSLVPVAHRLSASAYLALSQAFLHLLPSSHGDISVIFVTPGEIRRLNRMYRGKDTVTDVLSFAHEKHPVIDDIGEVLICYEKAVAQATDGDIELELTDLVVHGALHVLGYDHEEPLDASVMFPLQDAIVQYVLRGSL
jgi:probable rRNA maturation factor